MQLKDSSESSRDFLSSRSKYCSESQVVPETDYPPARIVDVGLGRLFSKIHRLSHDEKVQIFCFLCNELNLNSCGYLSEQKTRSISLLSQRVLLFLFCVLSVFLCVAFFN